MQLGCGASRPDPYNTAETLPATSTSAAATHSAIVRRDLPASILTAPAPSGAPAKVDTTALYVGGYNKRLEERSTNLLTMGRDELGQRSETVRRSNLSAIVRELHADGPLSRSELVARTGLTRSAIRGLIGELVVAGLVVEERAAPLGTPGRPSPLVHLKPDGAVVLGLEIAVDSVAVAVVGLGGVVFEIARVDRPRGKSSVDETAADLAALVAEGARPTAGGRSPGRHRGGDGWRRAAD